MKQLARFVGMKCNVCNKPVKKIEEIAATHSQNGKQKDVLCQKCSSKGLMWDK